MMVCLKEKMYYYYIFCTAAIIMSTCTRQCSATQKPKILVVQGKIPDVGIQLLKQSCEVIQDENITILSYDQFTEKVKKGVDGIFMVGHIKVDKALLDAAGPQLKIVSLMSVGYDHVDLQELKKRNIAVTNTPRVLTEAVADVAVMLALAASRRLHEGRRHIEEGTWERSITWMLGPDIKNSTVGIVGFGGIGLDIAQRLQGFEINRILYSGHREKPEAKKYNAHLVPLNTLLEESDFVFVAAPLTPETQGMFNDTTFAKMKKTSVFVNVARGAIVNQDSLYKALKNGVIFAAGLDVMTPEPLPANDPLLGLKNCVITPHIGSATVNTRNSMAELAANNILNYFAGKPLITPL